MVFGLFRRRRHPEVHATYSAIVAQARQFGFYSRLQVPDTIDGRFEMLILHMILVLNRLRGEGDKVSEFSQELFDLFFADMDGSLREMGVGDLGVPKKVKKMAEAFYGRAAAFAEALASDTRQPLVDVVERNFFAEAGNPVAASAIAAYLREATGVLAGQEPDEIMAGRLRWPDLPTAA